MHLYLLRHAEAHYTNHDASRELTTDGRQTILDLAEFLEDRIHLKVDLIWHSPLVRACQTAELFKQAVGIKAPLQEVDGLCPMDPPHQILEKINAGKSNLLLVGHNPHFESLCADLLGIGSNRIPINVAKSSLLHFRRDFQNWQLRQLLTAKITSSR